MFVSSYNIRYFSEGLAVFNIINMNRLIVSLLQGYLTSSLSIFSPHLETIGAIQEEQL